MMTGNIKSNNTVLFITTLKEIYLNKMLNNGYVTDIVEIVDISLGEIHRNICNYTVVALVEIVSLYPENILEDCEVKSIEKQGGMIFLSKYPDNRLKIMMDVGTDNVSDYTIKQKVDVRIQGSSVKYMATTAEILATPVSYQKHNTFIASQLYTLDINNNDQELILNDYKNITYLNDMRKKVNNKYLSVYQENNINNEHKEIKKILSLFYPRIVINFNEKSPDKKNTSDEFITTENNIYAVRMNMFDINFDITEHTSKTYFVNYIVSSISYMSGVVYVLYTESSGSKDVSDYNENIYLQFMNNYLTKLIGAYYDELYVIDNKLDWSKDINDAKLQYKELIT